MYLNGESQGARRKTGDDLHVEWSLSFTPGTLKAIGRIGGREILIREVKTAGAPAKIVLEADRSVIAADGEDLSFVTVKILDEEGTAVPYADNPILFEIFGAGKIAGIDNGLQTSEESFSENPHKAFNGLCLAVVESNTKSGKITLKATSEGLAGATVVINAK